MRVCITARASIDSARALDQKELLDTQVDPRFGRCVSFVIVDMESMKLEVKPNFGAETAHGAGVQAAQMIANQGVEVVITGRVGPNAYAVLSASKIKIVTGASGTIGQVIEQYKSGLLHPTRYPDASSHFGQNMDIEKKDGWGVGSGIRYNSSSISMENLSADDELAALEKYKRKLGDDLEGINARIKELKNLAEKNSETK
jgi:predicted Fe-Mo cluster-binding NifX family protein